MRHNKKDIFKLDFWMFFVKHSLNLYAESANTKAKQKLLGAHKGGGEIYTSASIRQHSQIFVGKEVLVGPGCTLWPGTGKIILKDNILLGPGVQIFGSNHQVKKGEIIRTQAYTAGDVIIESDCWVGANSTINAGVTLGEGTVVASGSVVTKDTEPYSIVAGVPAKLISRR
ncbi:acyltransferase [Priestia sp. YIM B13486]|uniref:acyltransferase n=1 Tax=Priestia sp. YIM B13486 TaxID=3366304 RepID=UPI00366C79F7